MTVSTARVLALTVAAMLGSTLALDCRQALDLDHRAACETPGAVPSECEACTQSACCDAYLACLDSIGCATLEGCVSRCDPEDEACERACWLETPYGLGDAYAALTSCRVSQCSEACGLGCGGYPYLDPACASCATGCCDEEAACGADAECLAVTFCERGCAEQDHECRGECQRSHRAGLDGARTFGNCLEQRCAPECGFLAGYTDWSCLEDAPEPPGEGPPVEVVLQFVDLDAVGYPDVPVQACPFDATDLDCSSPIASGLTDASGEAKLSVPHGFDGYFVFEGGGDAASPNLPMPSLLFSGPVTSPATLGVTQFSFDQYQTEFAAKVSASVESSRGHLFAKIVDCADSDSAAPKVAFEVEPSDGAETHFYGFAVPLPGGVTSYEGVGGFFNLPPGWVRVTATRHDTYPPECVASREVLIRAGSETDVLPLSPDTASCLDR